MGIALYAQWFSKDLTATQRRHAVISYSLFGVLESLLAVALWSWPARQSFFFLLLMTLTPIIGVGVFFGLWDIVYRALLPSTDNTPPHFAPNIQRVITQGHCTVTLPMIYLGGTVTLAGIFIGIIYKFSGLPIVVLSTILGVAMALMVRPFLLGRWQKWALQNEISADELKFAAEAMLLLWPKGFGV